MKNWKRATWSLLCCFAPVGLPGSVIEFQAAAQSNANLMHQYTFDGADDDARIEDKKGSADLEIKPFGSGTADDLGLGETGFDGSSQAVSIFRSEGSDHTGGAALHQPSITLGESVSYEAIFQPRQEEISGGTWNLGYIVATRVGGDRGYFLIQGEPAPSEGTVLTSTTGDGHRPDNTNRILEPVIAGHWYYAAGSYSADTENGTVTFTNYIADLTAGDTVLTAVGPFTNSSGTYPIGDTTLGIGQRWDAGEAFPGLIDEVNLYQSELAQGEFQAHLDMLTGGGVPFAITAVSVDSTAGTVMITWTSNVGQQYAIEGSDDLLSWEEIDDGIEGESDTTSYIVTELPALPALKYYRVQQLE
jgi:hypothetical protein